MNDNKKHKEYRSRLKFVLLIILIALFIYWEIISHRNYSIIVWIIILSCLVISTTYILFQNFKAKNKVGAKNVKKLVSLQYENKLFYYVNFLKDRLFNDWKNYKIIICCIILIIILLSFEPILFFAKYTYGLAQWISGIGSLSAASVALFTVVHRPKPHLGHFQYSDPEHNIVIIQFFNTSKTPDFIRLKSIYMSNKDQFKEVPLYAKFNKMVIFNAISINNSCTFIITDQTHLPFGRYCKIVFTELLNEFERQRKYTVLTFNFANIRETYNISIHFVLNKDLNQK